MRSVVLGASGFVAAAIVDELLRPGDHVVAVDGRPPDDRLQTLRGRGRQVGVVHAEAFALARHFV